MDLSRLKFWSRAPDHSARASSSAWDANHTLPSNYSYSQVAEAIENGSLAGFGSLFYANIGGTVVEMRYPALMRCVTLISALGAQLITRAQLKVMDLPTGKEVKTPEAENAVRLLQGRPDGLFPAYTFIEGLMADLLLDGNAIVRAVRAGDRVTRLIRQAVTDAEIIQSTTKTPRYRTRDWNQSPGPVHRSHPRNIGHARWGSLIRSTGGSDGRSMFATPPLTLMRSALNVGALGEKYVAAYFENGANSAPYALAFQKLIQDDQYAELMKRLRSRGLHEPLVVGELGEHGSIIPLGMEAQRQGTQQLREFQVQEIARIYGVPAPLVGLALTSWGSGIEELGRMGWRFCARQHVDRLLVGLEYVLLEPGQRFKIDHTDVTRGSPESMVTVAQTVLGGPNGPRIGEPEEVRPWFGLDPNPPKPLPSPDPPQQPNSQDTPPNRANTSRTGANTQRNGSK